MKITRHTFSLLLMLFALNSHAFTWQDLWKSKNQQAKEMMKNNDFSSAKNTFKDENWRAVAAFRAKDYQMAADFFAKSTTIDAPYNLGNALANLGKYEDAINAYDKMLTIDKNHEDAKHNKKIIEKLLQQQKKQNNKNNNQKKSKNQQKSENKNNSKNPKEQKQNTDNPQQNPPKKDKNPSKNTKQDKIKKQNKQNANKKKSGKNQMQEQWLKLIPDDPGGLLREKFKRDYLRRRGELN